MFDYSFFAMLFAVATSLAPADATQVEWVNVRHPQQSLRWERASNGSWAMTVNERDVGRWVREASGITHRTGPDASRRFPLQALVRESDLVATTSRIRLRGQFSATTLAVERDGERLELVDPVGRLLATRLRLRFRR